MWKQFIDNNRHMDVIIVFDVVLLTLRFPLPDTGGITTKGALVHLTAPEFVRHVRERYEVVAAKVCRMWKL